jgi:hypothetical protein
MAKKQISNYKFVPGNVVPDNNLYPNAVALLDANKKFIQEETLAFISYNVANNIEPYVFYTYNVEKCRRDISYIIEGYITDIKHGGNRQTVSNASKYFENGIPQIDGDRAPEFAAHTFIKGLILNYIFTNTTFTTRQAIKAQVVDNANLPEAGGITKAGTLADIVINVITNGLSSVPAIESNRGYVKFPGFFKLKDLLLITNTNRNIILYNFADPTYKVDLTYSENYDSDFPGALYGNEKITTITFDFDTSEMMVTDNIQIFVEGKEQIVKLDRIGTDAMERQKVGIPQSMLDADFEYGLQPTKWQAISLMRNYPAIYEIPSSDISVLTVTTDASTGTSGTGASKLTVTTLTPHGLVVGNPITVKALANSVTGFSRAEGSFLVGGVDSTTQFFYYAKAKVGTSNGQVLSSTYTQLRKGAYYTGAAIGTASYNVFSAGSSGTVTTNLITGTGRDIIGFTGSPPPLGAPLSGTGIPSGAQVTAVIGSGGTQVTGTLQTIGNVGDTVITLRDTAGVTTGLIFNRGDGVSVTVTDVTGNDVTLSGALTSAIVGYTQSYAALTQNTTTGTGTGARITVSREGPTYSATPPTPGNGYVVGDQITILGTQLGGANGTNNATLTVTAASPKNTVSGFFSGTLTGGTGYSAGTGVTTSVSPAGGDGLTVDVLTDGFGTVTGVLVNTPGYGYNVNDTITILSGNSDATIDVAAVTAGGLLQTVSATGTPVSATSVDFASAFTMSDVTTSQIASGNTGITYSAIATIEATFATPHGFIPGNTITSFITSNDTGAQLAAGPFFVEQVPTSSTIRYTARAAGTINNTLTGFIYGRPDSFFVHRPFDGGVQLGTGSPSHGATAIRMSKKYIRYQSGKGVSYNTGALFAPSYDVRSMTSTGTAVGSVITLSTDDTDHGCQVGAQIQVTGITTSGYNGVYTVSDITDERTLSIVATQTLGATTAVIGNPCQMTVRNWHGSTVRAGIFDDQNGMFWQYDGLKIAVGRRSSTFQVAGTISVNANSSVITGTNTRFTSQLTSGDRVVIRGMSHVISSITSDTAMTISPDFRGVSNVSNVKICKTQDIIIPQENWNLDPCNGSGPSGYNIDITKMQMIGIQHTWYGAGFIDFMLRGPDGNYVFAHRFRNSNVNTEAYMRTGNQPVRYEVINEGAKGRLSSAMTDIQTTVPMAATDAYWFPRSGVVIVDNELIRYTGNSGTALTGCVRASNLTQFVAGAQRTFTGGSAASHLSGAGVILVSNTVTPIISHWGSAFMIDGQFDSDRGYIFNYASTGTSVSVDKATAFLIRLAPSVSNAQVGDLGEKELLNRAQLLLGSISITSDSVAGGGAIVVEGLLNPSNYPEDPTKITWTGLSSTAAGGQPSFAQIASGGSVSWGGNAFTTTATVQGAFTSTLTAKSFNAATQNLTATSFGAVTTAVTAFSQPTGTAGTATGGATTAVAAGFYNRALLNTRSDFLISMANYNTITTTLSVNLDTLSVATFLIGSQKVTSITPNYTNISGTLYARVIMNANASAASAANTSVTGVTITYSSPTAYTTYLNSARTDFLIPQAQASTVVATDVLSLATYLTGGQTVSSVTSNYLTIAGAAYARVIMSKAADATPSAGAGTATVLSTSAATATYGWALSAIRSDFLITDTQYDTIIGLAAGDGLSFSSTATLSSVQITGTGGQFSCTSTYLVVGMTVTISGTYGGTGSITGYANPTTYRISATNGSTTFTLTTVGGTAIVTTSGTPTGLTYTLNTFLTAGTSIQSATRAYITINSVSYSRIVMNTAAVLSSTSGTGNDVTIVVTAAGSAASYVRTNYLFFDSTTWLASGATIGTKVASDQTQFPGGTAIAGITTRTYASTTVYRITFTQSANTTINAASTLKFQFGAPYAFPGEQVFSFIANPGNTEILNLSELKELTATTLGGRGAFPNGPDVLAINVYKVSGTATPANIILRWGEAQA